MWFIFVVFDRRLAAVSTSTSTSSSLLLFSHLLKTETQIHTLPTSGRAWTAADLRKKSWDDLHSLWIVLLKEKNLLLSERDAARARKERLANPFRATKVRKSMSRVKAVMWERAQLESKDLQELRSLKAFIDAL